MDWWARAVSSVTEPQSGRTALRPCSVPARACSVSDVDLGDEQPTQHAIGRRTYIVAQVEPLDVDGVRTTEVGTALWLLGFLGLLPFWGTLQDNGRTWLLWTCLAGFGLGLCGLEYCRRRRKERTAQQAGR